jgi:hypothetical protein
LPTLSTEQFAEMLPKLNDVCRQAQELSQQIKRAMVERTRRDQQLVTSPDRREPPRKRPHT